MKLLFGYLVVFALGATLLLHAKGCVDFFLINAPKTIDRTTEWKAIFRKELDGWFWIPQQATLVRAEERTEFMGGGSLVVFTLPPTREPIEWLELMATKSEFNGCRKSKTKFDCGGDISRLGIHSGPKGL